MNPLLTRDSPNVLFYSKHCKHCTSIISFYQSNNITNLVTGICIDNRRYTNKGTEIITENGQLYTLPPNVDSVPTLMAKFKNGTVTMIVGDNIKQFYSNIITVNTATSTQGNGEPVSSNAFTERGKVGELLSINSTYNNYASIHDTEPIVCQTDTFIPDNIKTTIDNIVQQRELEISDIVQSQPPPFA